ncbi:DUF4349 domain-containing protein [Streptacidiphilus carbonis]|jgi:hypothetical protein|uniref:DUF4349 domain-containing protein n=1 Tax=Streptacidiphilus carbonis TaxID=105422 RepID=UPI0009FC2007|nr:DUF4349 domain-containing protein [Streptacidiphilus carbonis]
MRQSGSRRSRRRGTALGAVVLAGGLALGACSASSEHGSSTAAGGAANRAASAPQAQAGTAGSGSSAAGKSAGGTSSAQLQAAQAARSIIYTGEIQLRTGGVDAAAARAEALVKSVGGYIDSEVTGTVGSIPYVPYPAASDGGTGSTAQTLSPPADASGDSAQLVLRVPAASYDGVFSQLQTLGTVLAQQRTAQDVTQQVVDLDSRVKSAQASVARVRALYDKAQSIADITTLEQDLTQRESDLESLEAQQQALESQAAMSTVTLELYAKATAPAAPHGRSAGGAALSALKSGWHALYLTFRWLLVVLAAVLPFLVPIGLLMWLVQVLARRRRLRAEPELELEAQPAGGGSPSSDQGA